MNRSLRGKIKGSLFLTILILASFLFISCCYADGNDPVIKPSFPKGLPEGFGRALDPNVILLVDTSGSMTYDTKDGTYTHGDGGIPTLLKDGSSWERVSVNFGRDTDDSNNSPWDVNNYHPQLRYMDQYNWVSNFFDQEILGEGTSWEEDFYALYWADYHFADDDGRYLFPNDSRMYKLKLVLYNLFSDPTLLNGLRVGLSTFHQTYFGDKNENGIFDEYHFETDDPFNSTWYYWVDWEWGWWDFDGDGDYEQGWIYDFNDRQRVTWMGGTSYYGDLRVGIDDWEGDHISELKSWVDGKELILSDGSPQNPELRAEGSTPLEGSIHNDSSKDDCIYDFFGQDGVIEGWCQDNWLIVLTDAQSPDPAGSDPVQAVSDLYHDSKTLTSFFDNDNQPVRTLAIGFIDSADINNQQMVTTLQEMADVGIDGKDSGDADNDPGKAYFANDVPALMQSFRDIFDIIQSRSGSGGAPLVSPAKLTGESSSVYVASFVPYNNQQWEGSIKKYSFDDSQTITETPDWDAGDILDNTVYTSRNVYTVDWISPLAQKLSDSNVALLRPLQAANLKAEISSNSNLVNVPTGDAAYQGFISWILGDDTYNSGNDERWKLGDIYHSGLTEVGPPSGTNPHSGYRDFQLNNSDRDSLVYFQANDGMLHAVSSKTDIDKGIVGGEERWAFMPPNVLSAGRLLGTRGIYVLNDEDNWEFQYYGADDPRSVPRYLLDGPVVAEDVFDRDNDEWKTVLLGELGYAGAGLYALDVTSPDLPQFMWSIENNIYTPSGDGTISDDLRSVSRWHSPTGSNVSFDEYTHAIVADDMDYSDLRFTLSVPIIGSMKIQQDDDTFESEWVALLGNGSPLGKDSSSSGALYAINIMDGTLEQAFTASGNMSNIVTPVTVLNTNYSRRIEKFYAGDDKGKIFSFTWQDNNGYNPKHVLSIGDGDVGVSYRMEVSTRGNTPWLYILTGDYEGLVQEGDSNYMVAVNTNYQTTSMDLGSLDELTEDDRVSNSNVGWYFDFDTNEFPTTPPVLYSGYLFFSTFEANADPCVVGNSNLYVISASDGGGGWENEDGDKLKNITISGVKVSGITISEGRVFMGLTDYSGHADENLPDEMNDLNVSTAGNILTFDVPEVVQSNPFPIESREMVPHYWREWLR